MISIPGCIPVDGRGSIFAPPEIHVDHWTWYHEISELVNQAKVKHESELSNRDKLALAMAAGCEICQEPEDENHVIKMRTANLVGFRKVGRDWIVYEKRTK